MKSSQFAKFMIAVGFAVTAAACSDDSPNQELTAANSDEVAASAMSAMNLSLAGMGDDAIDIGAFGGLLGGPAFAMAFPNGQPAGFNAPDGCPSFTPDPEPDADQDGGPDNTLYTFTEEFCTIQGEGGTLIMTGSVRVSDPASVEIGFDIDFTQLTFATFEAGATEPAFAVVMDGTRSLRGQSTSLTLDENISVFVQAQGQQAGFSSDGSLAFTPEAGSVIDFDLPLPNGTIDWNGTFSAQSPEGFFVLNVQTIQLLGYDASCPNPENADGSIVDGVLQIAAGSNDGAGIVRITFNGCGVEPTVVFIGATT